jgi:hypothetical protein
MPSRAEAPGYARYEGRWEANARLAWDTLARRPTKGIPTFVPNVMSHALLEEIGGHPPGSYRRDPVRVYLDFQRAIGTCLVDQWIPENPLTMGEGGYEEETERGATTGGERIVRDGVEIDSPERAVEHMERFVFPRLEAEAREVAGREEELARELVRQEVEMQDLLGPSILKAPYHGFLHFPRLDYSRYGYANYFMAWALWPEMMERHFRLQADVAVARNRAVARAFREGGLPPMLRLDHDMADSRGTLVGVRDLDRLWFPHFARAIRPLLDAGLRLIWHCDGNLMAMVPRLLEAGLRGFQGFQYEDGMDYERICRMRDRDGEELLIVAGVSVTRALPLGTRQDVADQMKWLVEKGPRRGLFLAASSSVAPATNPDNVRAFLEGLAHYRERGRG